MTADASLDARTLRDGDDLGSFEVAPVGLRDFVRYAGASGDFNPMHFDDAFARAAGGAGVFGPGIFAGGILARLIGARVGVGRLRAYRMRFRGRIWPGDRIICGGQVVRRFREHGESLLELRLTATNQHGEPLVEASAVVSADASEDPRERSG
jgi:acyl dehydratase